MKPWFRTSMIGLAFVLAALTACSRERSGDVQEGPGGSDAIDVVLEDDEFDPDVLELEAGTEVTVEVRNDGSYGHTFTIDSVDLSTGTVEPDQVVTATFEVPSGTTEFHCTFHPGMDGEMSPEPGQYD
jgi:plastocyanin